MTLLERRQSDPTSPRRLTRLAVGAFADQPQARSQWPLFRHVILWLILLAAVSRSDVRTDPAGRAMCLLDGSKRPREWPLVLAVSAATVGFLALVVVWPPLFWLISVLTLVIAGPQAVMSARSRQARKVLAAGTPPKPYIAVHTVASAVPGAGRRLLQKLNAEADAMGWVLVLDAANSHLARYYSQFGYQATCEPTRMPWGEDIVRMVRRPSVAGGNDSGE